jgi:hypothetical protein
LLCLALLASGGIALAQETTTEVRKGTVLDVYGNHLVVRMSTGEVRDIDVPEDFRFNVGGKQVPVQELTPGMQITAVIKTTSAPKAALVHEVRQGEVVRVMQNRIWVRTDKGIERFDVPRDFTFNVGGNEVPTADLRPGMRLTATIVTTGPTEIVSEREVQAYAQKPPPPKPAPRPAARPAPAPAPPPKMPSTGSPLPLIGLLGLAFLALGLGLALVRRTLLS